MYPEVGGAQGLVSTPSKGVRVKGAGSELNLKDCLRTTVQLNVSADEKVLQNARMWEITH